MMRGCLHGTSMTRRCVVSDDFVTQLREAIEAIKKQSDEYWADPASKTCGIGFPHTVGGKSIKIVDVGTFMVCIECGQVVEVPNG